MNEIAQMMVPQPAGADTEVLAQARAKLMAMGQAALTMPGAQVFQELGVMGQIDPGSIGEYDTLSPEQRAPILLDAIENPFFNLRDSLAPQGYSPFDQFDVEASAPRDPMLAALNRRA